MQSTDRLPSELLQGPFTYAQACAAGLTKDKLRARCWRHVFRNVWIHADVPDTREMRLAALRLVLPPHGVLCGRTSAWVYGADVHRIDDLDVDVSFARGKRRRDREGVRVRQETLDAGDWVEVDGVRVTTPLRTAFDCLRWLPAAEGLVVADALAHLDRLDVDALAAYFAGKTRLRNLRIGEALVPHIEPKSESPMESRTRWLLVSAGLPRPEAQYEVFAPSGVFLGRADLAYPEHRVIVEYDGAWHWKQKRQDERRRAAMRAAGWTVLVYDADDIYGAPGRVVGEVAAALRRARQAG